MSTATLLPREALYNAKNAGVVGDGTTDDTAGMRRAVANAVALGKRGLFIPEGSYLFPTSVEIDPVDTPFSVQGAGPQSRLIFPNRLIAASGSIAAFDFVGTEGDPILDASVANLHAYTEDFTEGVHKYTGIIARFTWAQEVSCENLTADGPGNSVVSLSRVERAQVQNIRRVNGTLNGGVSSLSTSSGVVFAANVGWLNASNLFGHKTQDVLDGTNLQWFTATNLQGEECYIVLDVGNWNDGTVVNVIGDTCNLSTCHLKIETESGAWFPRRLSIQNVNSYQHAVAAIHMDCSVGGDLDQTFNYVRVSGVNAQSDREDGSEGDGKARGVVFEGNASLPIPIAPDISGVHSISPGVGIDVSYSAHAYIHDCPHVESTEAEAVSVLGSAIDTRIERNTVIGNNADAGAITLVGVSGASIDDNLVLSSSGQPDPLLPEARHLLCGEQRSRGDLPESHSRESDPRCQPD
jgi:hypothetical protein